MSNGDVERHFLELQKQLVEDGFEADSLIMKTAVRLGTALRTDGFAFIPSDETPEPELEESSEEEADEPELVVASPVVSEDPTPPPFVDKSSVLRAFRARDEYDTTVITSVFARIDGWKTRVVHHKGSHYVVATNEQTLTPDRIKQALLAYVSGLSG